MMSYFWNFRYERGAVKGSINIPFTSVQLSHTSIESLGNQAKVLADPDNNECIVVVIGPHDQNNALVSMVYYFRGGLIKILAGE